MGWHEKSITIKGVRSAHNSLQDRIDQAKWEYLRGRIDQILASDDYESLRIEVWGPSD